MIKTKISKIFLVAILLISWVATPAFSKLSGQSDLGDFEQRLAKINTQIKQLQTRIANEARRERSIISELTRLNLNKAILTRELEAQYVLVEKASAELKGFQKRSAELETKLNKEMEIIEQILVSIYKFGQADFSKLLLQTENFEVLSAESKRLVMLAQYEQQEIQAFLKSLDELKSARAGVEEKKRNLSEQIRLSEFKRRELEDQTKKNAALIKEIQTNKIKYQQTLLELEDSANQLQVLMRKIAAKEWILTGPFIPLIDRKGKLLWPVDGKIITRFGVEIHPRFKTVVVNKGIKIAPDKSAAVIQAIHTGKVVFADYFSGYGNLIIIDHGLTYYSLYGHCSEFLIKTGDMVNTGQPIAITGDSDSLKGESLYFEIRHKADALDPLLWLRKK